MAVIMEKHDDPKAAEKIADFIGPEMIDHFIRQAIQYCWMALPAGRKSEAEMERQIRRLFERALKDFREDREAFGRGSSTGATAGRAEKGKKQTKSRTPRSTQ